MKRFMLFAGSDYYPDGGMHDFVDSFDTYEDAVAKGNEVLHFNSWYHIYDAVEKELFKEVTK